MLITTRDIHVQSLSATLSTGGSISAEVHYNPETKIALLETTLNAVPSKALVPETSLAKKLKGRISGNLNTESRLDEETTVQSTYNLTARRFHLSTVALPPTSRIKGSVLYKIKM